MKLGLIAFANESGVGYQTKRLCEFLRPDRLLVIDSTVFSKNKKQHFEWYEGFTGYRVNGFPTNHEVRVFLEGLTHVFCVENPLNYSLTAYAERRNIKVFIQTNYEFCDFLDKNLTLPHRFVMPSHWKVEEMSSRFGDKVLYLPPPINPDDFKAPRQNNLQRTGRRRFLHIVGTLAVHDRNGTQDLLHALQYTKEDFELVVTSQHDLPEEYLVSDNRVRYVMGQINDPVELYNDFDALILPRRYGGLSLPMAEALLSGLPVIMTDISPNNQLLPREWLVPAVKDNTFMARVPIDVYVSSPMDIAKKIDEIVLAPDAHLAFEKTRALQLGHDTFSFAALREKYANLWNQ